MQKEYITYKDICDRDPVVYFAQTKEVSPKAIEAIIKICDLVGYKDTIHILEAISPKDSNTQTLSYRDIKYIYKVTKLHKELLYALKRGAMISEEGIISRIQGDFEDLVEEKDGKRIIKGSYRELVLRKA